MGIIFYVEFDGVIYFTRRTDGPFRPTLSRSRGLSENEDFSKATTKSNRVISQNKPVDNTHGPWLIVVVVKFIGRTFLFAFPESPRCVKTY